MKKKLTTTSVLLLVVGGGTLILCGISLRGAFSHPEPYKVNLPEFAGRVLPSYQVKPGTFTIQKPFEETATWGEDAILSFGTGDNVNKHLVLQAWRPDPITKNLFQYARKSINPPWGICWEIERITREEAGLIVVPGRGGAAIFLSTMGCLVGVILVGKALVGVILVGKALHGFLYELL